jgi:hypothetical protein
MQTWVHRLSISKGGEPAAALPEREFEMFRALREIKRPAPAALPEGESEALAFLVSELLEHGRLRQGWGTPGLDLTKLTFHDNFVIAMRKYWNSIPESTIEELRARDVWDDGELFGLLESCYQEAEGRYKILRRMLQMGRGDVVFVPNIPEHGKGFVVARIADNYTFEDRSSIARTYAWEHDFGHSRKVRDVRVFQYGPGTLPAGIFGAPYKHAIDKVSARKAAFEAFLLEHYGEQAK